MIGFILGLILGISFDFIICACLVASKGDKELNKMIDIVSYYNYEVIETIFEECKVDNHDVVDWYTKEQYINKYIMSAKDLINKINQILNTYLSELSSLHINTTKDGFEIVIDTFNNKTGTTYKFKIKKEN